MEWNGFWRQWEVKRHKFTHLCLGNGLNIQRPLTWSEGWSQNHSAVEGLNLGGVICVSDDVEEHWSTRSGHIITDYCWYLLVIGSMLLANLRLLHILPPKLYIYKVMFCCPPQKSSRFTELFCPTIFLPDLRECNNSNDSDLLYKVTVRGACQGTIFPDRLLICHSYCCGYCMTVHVLSSSSLLTFMFHLISLLFLGVYDIKILSCCLFKCGALRLEFSGLSFVSAGIWKGWMWVQTCRKSLCQHPNTNFHSCLFFFLSFLQCCSHSKLFLLPPQFHLGSEYRQ